MARLKVLDSRNKSASFSSVKDVLEKRKVVLPLDYHSKNKQQQTGMIAAPIEINGKRHICIVKVIKNVTDGRLYVHEVFEQNNLLDEVASNLVHNSTNTASPHHQGEVVKVLNNILSTNNSSKVVDENGEPLVVYHGTQSFGFSVFDKKKSNGLIYTSNRGTASEFGDSTNFSLSKKEYADMTDEELIKYAKLQSPRSYQYEKVDLNYFRKRVESLREEYEKSDIKYLLKNTLDKYNALLTKAEQGQSVFENKNNQSRLTEFASRENIINSLKRADNAASERNSKNGMYHLFANIRDPYRLDAQNIR